MKRYVTQPLCRVVGCLVLVALPATVRGEVLIDIDWEEHAVDTLLHTIPGWQHVFEDAGNVPVIEEETEPAPNKFLTTGTVNNQPTRYAFQFTNPGFFSGTTLTFTVDYFDPMFNTQSSLSTFPRAYLGIYELDQPTSMPPYFGIEHDSNSDDVTTAEWVVSGENFSPQMYSFEGSIAQDTWYTARSEWDFAAGTMNLFVKPRDSTESFTEIFSNVPIEFDDPAQDLAALDALQIRMLRGTRIDNILIEYDEAMLPEDLLGDYNGDNVVNAADYTVWRDTFGSTTDLAADGDESGTVDDADFGVWTAHFGESLGGGSSQAIATAVPEASSLTVLLLGTALASLWRRSTVR